MPSPVVPNEFCDSVPSANSDLCVKMEKFFNVPQKLCDLFGWMLNADGSISDAFKSEIAAFIMPTGTFIHSATLNMGASFLQCTGVAVSRTTYAALFQEIGTRYGAGDGSTTFNLPNAQGRSLIGAGSGSGLSFRDITAVNVGAERVTLTEAQLPAHSHTFRVNGNDDGGSGSGSAIPDDSSTTLFGTLNGETEDTGQGVPVDIVHPCLVAYVFIRV